MGIFKRMSRRFCLVLVLSLLPLSMQAEEVDTGAPADGAVEEVKDRDPLEGMNRAIFSFNDVLDRFIVLPIVKSYAYVTPDPVEDSFSRMFANLREFKHIFNDVLQWRWKDAANDTGRLAINTTIGIAGLFDVASEMGLEPNKGSDFGQTLGVWGVPSGPYLVVPFFGPSTFRDAPGLYVDAVIHPIIDVDDVRTRNVLIAWGLADLRLRALEAERFVEGDRYTFIRDAYLNHRDYTVSGEIVDDFGGDVEDDEFNF